MSRGLFITFEGGDGAGKSTQIELLKKHLEDKGIEVVLTREPGGTSISESIRDILLDCENSDMEPMTEAFLYAAARAQLVNQVIRPLISEGKTVICDRFVDSSIAYQAYGRKLGDCVSVINNYAVGLCIPDITFLLKVDPEIGSRRISNREQDRIELASDEFHRRVYDGYLELEQKHHDRIVGINACDTIENISKQISCCIDVKLKQLP